MKRTALTIAAALMLAGCANLNVSWSFTASYKAVIQQQGIVQHLPADMVDTTAPAAPVAPGKTL